MVPTPTGIELIQLIHEELLKSAELTGIWEKKLREIERKSYDAATFLNELKQMVSEIVYSVLSDSSNRRVTVTAEEPKPTAKRTTRKKESSDKPKANKPRSTRKTAGSQTTATNVETKPAVTTTAANQTAMSNFTQSQKHLPEGDAIVGQICPICGKGRIIKGKTAYGCSEWKNGCKFRKPF